jgi:hypothetical protein
MNDAERLERYGKNAAEEAKRLFDRASIQTCWDTLLRRLSSGHMESEPRVCSTNPLQNWLERHLSQNYPYPLRTTALSPKVSFIIPLYNKATSIERTLRSVLNCGYNNFEIIVVDDGSTDGSDRIVTTGFSEHITFLQHSKNHGLSVARNTGLEQAQGEYIQFWDAGDIYHAGALIRLVDAALIGSSEIVTGIACRDQSILPTYESSQITFYALKQPYCHRALQTMSACFKLYERRFLMQKKLRFVESLYMQDTEFNLRAFSQATSVSMTDVLIGEYVVDDGSRNSQVVSEARIQSAFDIFERMKRYTQPFSYLSTGPEDLSDAFHAKNTLLDIAHSANLPEDFWQMIVLKFVFRFFVVKLLKEEHFNSSTQTTYLTVFKTCLQHMKPGLRKLFASSVKNDQRCCIFFSLLLLNQDHQAQKILRIALRDLRISDLDQPLSSCLDLPLEEVQKTLTAMIARRRPKESYETLDYKILCPLPQTERIYRIV